MITKAEMLLMVSRIESEREVIEFIDMLRMYMVNMQEAKGDRFSAEVEKALSYAKQIAINYKDGHGK